MAAIASFQLGCFSLENFHELVADDFAFRFRVINSGKFAHELFSGIHMDNPCVQAAGKHFHHHFAFIQAQ